MVYHLWPVGQAVKTSPSHGENRSSILLRVTIDLKDYQQVIQITGLIFRFIVGVYYAEGPPVPFPNTVVKLTRADNSWRAASRKDRSSPT